MLGIEDYMKNLVCALKETYCNRLIYVGLQGSYCRGEADDNSDIDIMVVLDNLQIEDMDIYKQIISKLECADKSCGFICGKNELANWNECEICQLVHETKDYYGELKTLVLAYSNEDLRKHIKICVGNLYHEICHRYIHSTRENNKIKLRNSYKSVFYILQNLYYLKTGEYIKTKKELFSYLDGIDYEVLNMALVLKTQAEYDFEKAYSLLFDWCKDILQTV